MSVEVLRRAATAMRERAELTTPVPCPPRVDIDREGTCDGCAETKRLVASYPEPDNEPWLCEICAADVDHITAMSPAVALAVADWLEKVMSRHAPVEWHEADPETDALDLDKPLPPFCRGCTDDEYVDAIDFGDVIDQSADVAAWPCPDFEAALIVARAYLGEPA